VSRLWKRTCLVCASIGRSKMENADSARRCRFRNSQQKRASGLDSKYGWIPKLDVAGSLTHHFVGLPRPVDPERYPLPTTD
jgi:hypothetical protein